MIWAGRILGAIVVLFMLMDATIHLMHPQPVVDAFAGLGYPLGLSVPLGLIEFACVVLYVIPKTNVLGSVLLTGYLGGAVAAQLRVGHPAFECTFPIIIGILAWSASCLLDARLRALLPLKR